MSIIRTKRRKGIFTICTSKFLGNDQLMLAIQNEMVVLDAKHEFGSDKTTFIAVHPAFDLVEEGERIPKYTVSIEECLEPERYRVFWNKTFFQGKQNG